ncbi:bifunctional glutamate N-acetyltransferase/amino-acid acetyltransferase ArgJ [Lentibacillus cibarius]|uniref:Arginine biosynthesis bifunctional protein ArgJ n=1 Tax=Lentibacillus cibarius TaxID=2583219 RepID=A0A549YL79_9BACI|nr:bifunctional glutamate N-acetyltransferase/amino-acid acetyltransferase ArgJ [Lentibacillus cibarius]TRM12642.1 bifunctional glutamate N-acetyltransferase/amino-acid acetyltransferase ArgJ [Lentibacillus cibarius]
METYTEVTDVGIEPKEGGLTSAKGFHAGGFHCGFKRKRPDLGWIYSDTPANTAAVYTTNQFQAAPLQVTKESIAQEKRIQGVLINSAVANACTGEQGLQNAYQMRRWFAEKLGIQPHLVAVNSTGVIGEQLPMDTLAAGIEQINLDDTDEKNFERAILTTDTFTKNVCVQVQIGEEQITIGGAAKGSGMIEPNMATMLAFLTTDAAIEQESLDAALKTAVNKTFNCITVDGDTSTNDTVLVMANGKAMNTPITSRDPNQCRVFTEALTYVCRELAKQIARDGEGATKLIEVNVTGAQLQSDARAIGKAIVGSSLVKTAIYGSDPNWGRIICAIGYSGVALDTCNLEVAIGDIKVVENGMPAAFADGVVTEYLRYNEQIVITVNLHSGTQSASAWGCDLSYDYVKINASYRT